MDQHKERNNFIDFLRGTGIILVVLGHSIQFGSGAAYSAEGAFFENPVFRVIYSFHMPFFLLISGYLASGSIRRYSFPRLLKSRLKSLFVPIISWGIVQYLIQCALHHTPLVPHSILSCGRWCLENNWFLWATLFCTLLVGFIYDTQKDRVPAYIAYAAILFLSFVTPDNSRVALYKFVFPFFLAAFLLAGKVNHRKETFPSPAAQLVTILLYLILLHFFHKGSYIYVSRFSILGKDSAADAWKQVGIDLYRAALGFVGSFLCLLICAKLYRIRHFPPRCIVERLGRNSLGIYLISGILFEDVIAKLWVNHAHNIVLNLLETIAVLAVSDFLTGLLSKSGILSRIFLGGRRDRPASQSSEVKVHHEDCNN